ncbi:MAG: acetyl ornithine aminotransferase family protein [Chloroflexi bacterium]|nr:MAG: acetyl ornithine aminotransferase family protein [Chloroflexota bacterium]
MKDLLQGAGPKAQAWIERDQATMSTSFTREYPLVVSHAQGSEVWDVDGRRYVDFMAGIAVMNVGHRHPAVVEAVQKQIDKFWHICLSDFYYPEAVELAERLQKIAPMTDETRYYFGNSGTEAVEAAVKLAMYHTGRRNFIGFTGAFHGRTLGSLSFTASKAVQRGRYQPAVKVYHVPYPDTYRPVLQPQAGENYGETVVNYLESLFKTLIPVEDVAGILVEPIQGEGGYIVPAPGFFSRLRALCDQYGLLLIVDEIQSGVGRTGKWWGIEHEGVQPDILCFAKGIGSGMPIGGIMARKEVMTWKPGAHGSTFGGNPVAAAAASATLDVIEKEGLLEQARETGEYIMDALAEIQTAHKSIGQVRGRGLMIGIEFVKDRASKERAPEIRNAVVQKAFEKGLLLLQCGQNTLRMTPALNIPRSLVDEGLRIFAEAVKEAEAELL